MFLPDTVNAQQQKPETGVDARVLGHLMLIQSTLHVMPRTGNLADFVCHGLTSVPGVSAAGMGLDDLVVGGSSQFPETIPPPDGTNVITLPLQTTERKYGWIALMLADQSLFEPYRPHVQNLANVVAMTLENRQQQDRLVQLNQDLRRQIAETESAQQSLLDIQRSLENRVAERTADLLRANEALAAQVRERELAEQALRESEERMRLAQRAARIGIWDWDLQTGYVRWFEGQAALFGMDAAISGLHIHDLRSHIHPDDVEQTIRLTKAALDQHKDFDMEYRVLWPDRSVHWLAAKGRGLYDNHEQSIRMLGVNLDITERRQLEESFLQSQKMESIGRLAGGVAHDFNNILSAILGYAELAAETMPPNGDGPMCLEQIRRAAERAANLTQQLLAFARRQVISPKIVNPNALISDLGKMLHRLIGELVELRTDLDPDLGCVKVDPGQFCQILMNLAVNARDAMPDGGSLTIRTRNESRIDAIGFHGDDLLPGPYVLISVTDTGTGISDDVCAHVFEPFFTTKKLGEGTGLGLATCYGIVKQSGGHIWVLSEPGAGSTFAFCLPQVDPVITTESGKEPEKSLPVGKETVVVVDDDSAIRDLLVHALGGQGFTVLAAANGLEALDLMARHSGQIHALITDIVMPLMSGTELAAQVRKRFPAVKILMTSGYATREGAGAELPPGTSFLNKPFGVSVLVRQVRAMLDL